MGKGFDKGKSGNPEGRPKGSLSEKTLAWQNLGDFITETGAERVKEILSSCTKKEFMLYYPMLLEYFKPKLARTDTLKLPENTQPLTKIQIVDSPES